jgi:type IV pilus assembly protein PilM
MFDNPQASHTLGLELDAYSLKGVALSFTRGVPKLEASFDYAVEQLENNVKPLYTIEQKQQFDDLVKKHLVVTAMDTQDVLVRPMELKLKKEKDIDAVLAFQAEPILPYPTDNAIVDKIFLSQDKEGSKLTIFAVRKDHLAQHLQQWSSLIDSEIVTAAPLALALFAKQFAGSEAGYVLHLGIGHSLCILADQGKLIAAQAVPIGIENLAEALAQEMGIDQADARLRLRDNFPALQQEENAPLKTAVEEFRQMVTRTIYALAKQAKGREINTMLMTGPGANIGGLSEALCSSLHKTLVPLNDDPAFGMSAQELRDFALPLGEALSALPNCKDEINLRQQELAFADQWKRLKKPMMVYISLCIGVAFALTLFGRAYLSYQEGEVRLQYLDLLNAMNKPYDEFEKEFNAKAPSPRDLAPGEILSIADLSSNEIKKRLSFLEKEIQATPQTYPLQANIPLVSDVLAWISTHANFVGKDGSPALQIESLSYTMVKRPEPTKKNEKYQVKIELEFSSPTPKMAREFHDALIEPNDIVDSKGEIKWSSNRDRYRTSFFLKDKTVYPNS